MGTGSFPGVKRPGSGADHPPPSKRRGHERVGLYLYSPSGPSWPVVGVTFNLYMYGVPTHKSRTGDLIYTKFCIHVANANLPNIECSKNRGNALDPLNWDLRGQNFYDFSSFPNWL